jgi:hypothetical protein
MSTNVIAPEVTHVSVSFLDDVINRKRDLDGDVSGHDDTTCKKKRINFHNIADLIGSREQHKNNDSIVFAHNNSESNTRSVVSPLHRCLTPQSLDGGSNQSVPETHENYFQTITTDSFESNTQQGPPFLTPPTTPVPDVELSTADKKSHESVGVKKARTMYKTEQVYLLEQIFSRTQYPDPDTIEVLSKQLGISEAKIKVSTIFIICVKK